MKKPFFAAGLALVLAAGYSLTVFAQAKPETQVKWRQAAMTLQIAQSMRIPTSRRPVGMARPRLRSSAGRKAARRPR